LFSLGSAHFRSGNMHEALRCFRGAVAEDGSHAESRNALGVVLSATGEKESGAAEIARAIALDPSNAEFRYNLGNLRREQGDLEAAVGCYREALALDEGFLRAHVNLGCVLQEQGHAAQALEEYRNALSLDPTSPVLLKQVGKLSQALHDDDEALRAFERVLSAGQGDADLYHRVGSLRQSRGDLDEAIRCYRTALELNPELAETWAQLGTALILKKLPEEAYRALENALRIKPDFPEVLNNIGMVMKERGQADIAERCFRMALRSKKDYAPAFNNLGTLFLDLSRFSEAEEQFREAVRLSPEFHLAWNNLGNALCGLGNFQEAKQIYRSVIEHDPSIPEVHFNLAAALQHEHRFEESILGYDEALRLRPGYAEARLNRALVLLLRGELREGWRDYECRFQVKDPRRIYVPPGPENLRWDGSDIRGMRILVRPEQGFGDTIQFSRYIPLLAERGAGVLFECPKELCGLFRGFPGVETLIEFRAEAPSIPFDRYVQLLSLPGLLGTDSVASIPWPGPYVKADPSVADSVRSRFDDGVFHVGIAWGGNPVHRNDHNRSCALSEFLPLLDVSGVRIHSLQKGKPVSQLQSLPGGDRIDNLDPLLTDFSVTAAVLSHLDLVIAVDTSVAHLAGAMGRPVWTLIPYRPDWRWLLDRTDSPWYPGMKLFRQSSHADWAGVISEVRSHLIRMAGT
ncbi:MAG TPA: tetratricopeptide repeat protein, partial [Bacteroidota bacterium]|nr:tetratricopeptide repeat protein [Bacteroidota bacterium]